VDCDYLIVQMGNIAYIEIQQNIHTSQLNDAFLFCKTYIYIYVNGHGLDKTPLLLYWWHNVTSFVSWKQCFLVLSSDSAAAYSEPYSNT